MCIDPQMELTTLRKRTFAAWRMSSVQIAGYVIPLTFLVLMPISSLTEAMESDQNATLVGQCRNLIAAAAPDSHRNPNGGWELRHRWPSSGDEEVSIIRRTTNSLDPSLPPGRTQELEISCVRGELTVEFTFPRAIDIQPGPAEVVLAWNGEPLQKDGGRWTARGGWLWPGPVTGGEQPHRALAQKIFNSSQLAICVRDVQRAPMIELFDLDSIKERGAEVQRACHIDQ